MVFQSSLVSLSSITTSSNSFFFFFFNDTATTEIYTLSLHDALPICAAGAPSTRALQHDAPHAERAEDARRARQLHLRSEEHTSELQSPCNLVCRLLLEKKTTTVRSHPGSAPSSVPASSCTSCAA